MKICSRCKQLKDESEFCKDSSSRDGLRTRCKQCDKECREYAKLGIKYVYDYQVRNDKGQKYCKNCNQWKDESEFAICKTSSDGLRYICKECDKIRARNNREPRKPYAYEMHKGNLKQCTKCKEWKDISNFTKNINSKDGLSHRCRDCQHEYDKSRRKKDIVYSYELHKDGKKFCNTCKQWIDEKDFYKDKNSKDGLSSICKFCQQKYDREHKHIKRDYKRRISKNNINYKLNDAISTGIYTAIKKNKQGRHWEALVDYDLNQLKEHLEKQFDSFMNWDNYGTYWEIDHIIPKNQFSYTSYTDDGFKICWSLRNLRPLSKSDNRSRPKDGSDISQELKSYILNV